MLIDRKDDQKMRALKSAMLIEQTLGNITYSRNLQSAWSSINSDLEPHWLEIPFEITHPWQSRIPFYTNWSIRASWRARQQLNRLPARDMDVLFFHTQVMSLFSVDLMRRIPTVISLDATPCNMAELGAEYYSKPKFLTGQLFEALKLRLNRQALQAATALVPFSHWASRSLINDYGVNPERIHVLPPGVDVAGWAAPPRQPHDGPLRILFAGGDFVRKGGPLLLDVWRQHFRDRAELHIVTYGGVEPEPGVYVYTWMKPNSPQLKELFAQSDLFVLPTWADTIGWVFAEAGAARLPVVTTNLAGIPEIVQQGESGLLFPRGDGQALTQALAQVIDNFELRAAMGNRGHEIVNQNFNAQKNIRRLMDLLSQCASRKPVSFPVSTGAV